MGEHPSAQVSPGRAPNVAHWGWYSIAVNVVLALINPVVDLPPGTSDASLTVMQSIPLSGVVLVTSPQDLAGMVVRKAAQMAQRLGASIVGLVENTSYVICPQCGQEILVFGPSRAMQMAARLGVPLLGQLPLDAELACRCDEGEIEAYDAECFDPIVKPLVDRMHVVCPV